MSENRTSIVLLADGDLDEVKACVAAIEAHTAEGSYELVVVALDPAGLTSRWLSAQRGLSLVSPREPLEHRRPPSIWGSSRRSSTTCFCSTRGSG